MSAGHEWGDRVYLMERPCYLHFSLFWGLHEHSSHLGSVQSLHSCLPPLLVLKIWLSLTGPSLVPFTWGHGGDIMVGLLVFCFGRLFLEIFKGVLLLNVYLVIPLL